MAWRDKTKIELGEYYSEYESSFFKKNIAIIFMATNKEVGINQSKYVDEIIENETIWITRCLESIIEFYNSNYEVYKSYFGQDDQLDS